MKLIVWLIALFAAAVAVTLTAKHITGHASLVMPPYQLELPLDQFIIVVIVAFLVFYFLVRLTLGYSDSAEGIVIKKRMRCCCPD